MRRIRYTAAIALAAALALPARAHAQADTASRNIVETAVAAGSFNTLATALKAAGLVATLEGKGPFTVFAPTDEAFAKLPEGAVEKLLADTAQLKSVLLYHVVPGRYLAADVVKLRSAPTAAGASAKVSTNASGAMIDGAKIVRTDITASNGVSLVIDSVIMPPAATKAASGAKHDER